MTATTVSNVTTNIGARFLGRAWGCEPYERLVGRALSHGTHVVRGNGVELALEPRGIFQNTQLRRSLAFDRLPNCPRRQRRHTGTSCGDMDVLGAGRSSVLQQPAHSWIELRRRLEGRLSRTGYAGGRPMACRCRGVSDDGGSGLFAGDQRHRQRRDDGRHVDQPDPLRALRTRG